MRNFFEYIGKVFLFISEIIKTILKIPQSFRLIIEQIVSIGVQSLSIIIFTSFFAGMATAFQAKYQAGEYMPEIYIGMSTAKAFLIVLGPLLTGLIISGRVASSIAAELGTMKVTEQIDALETMAINPIRYLVLPRVIAGAISIPFLTVIFIVVACLGGIVCAGTILGIKPTIFIEGLRMNFIPHELWGGLLKAFCFGMIMTIMGSFYGFNAKGGAEGVGKAATSAVISSSILVLVFEFIIAQLVF